MPFHATLTEFTIFKQESTYVLICSNYAFLRNHVHLGVKDSPSFYLKEYKGSTAAFLMK